MEHIAVLAITRNMNVNASSGVSRLLHFRERVYVGVYKSQFKVLLFAYTHRGLQVLSSDRTTFCSAVLVM